MIWLKVDVATQPAPLNFLFDSGAGKSVLHLGTARRLGVRLGEREIVQGTQGGCTAYRIRDLPATVACVPIPREMLALDLTRISEGGVNRIDGLLGADFFRGRVVQIDYAAQKVRLLGSKEFSVSDGQMLPLIRHDDAFGIRVGVAGGAPEWMRLDTGCNGALEWVTARRHVSRLAGTSVATSAASKRSIRTDVLLGSERLSSVETGVHSQPIFAGEAGLVGNGLLSQFLVTVDVDGGRLLLRRAVR
jgi:Aspartyl protease